MKILKKKKKRGFWEKHENYLYKGFTGLFLKINHKIINKYSKQIVLKL